MKPYLMYKYFEKFPERRYDTYNYLDSDVLFTQPMDFTPFIQDDIWYGSSTRSYIGVEYVKSKGEELFMEMCKVCDVEPKLVESNDNHSSIGAQYFIKNNTAELWEEIYNKSNLLYSLFNRNHAELLDKLAQFQVGVEYKAGDEVKYSNIKYIVTKDHLSKQDPEKASELYSVFHFIQKWTAEMWSTIYVALNRGYTLRESDLMQFHWAGHTSVWESKPYFHNAGIVSKESNGVNFHKLIYYTITPFKKEIITHESSVSSKYVEWIRKTEKMFPELIFE